MIAPRAWPTARGARFGYNPRMGDRPTELGSTRSFAIMPGNALFEAAVCATGLDDAVARRVMTSVVNTIGTYPDELDPDELGLLLPEIERRLGPLAPAERVSGAMQALQHLLLGWDGGSRS